MRSSRTLPGHGALAAGPGAAVPEDEHWFQPDDYLVGKKPYRGEKLVSLRVAKALRLPAAPGDAGHFVDGTGRELETTAYWRTHAAAVDELAIGQLAFGKRPTAKSETRSGGLDRRTDHGRRGRRADGKVTVGDVVCDVGGVRVLR